MSDEPASDGGAAIPADESESESGEALLAGLSERVGTGKLLLGFVVAGVQEMASFDGLHVDLTTISDGEERSWSGEAICVLVGTVRRQRLWRRPAGRRRGRRLFPRSRRRNSVLIVRGPAQRV